MPRYLGAPADDAHRGVALALHRGWLQASRNMASPKNGGAYGRKEKGRKEEEEEEEEGKGKTQAVTAARRGDLR